MITHIFTSYRALGLTADATSNDIRNELQKLYKQHAPENDAGFMPNLLENKIVRGDKNKNLLLEWAENWEKTIKIDFINAVALFKNATVDSVETNDFDTFTLRQAACVMDNFWFAHTPYMTYLPDVRCDNKLHTLLSNQSLNDIHQNPEEYILVEISYNLFD